MLGELLYCYQQTKNKSMEENPASTSSTRRKRIVSDSSDSDYTPETKRKTSVRAVQNENVIRTRSATVKRVSQLTEKSTIPTVHVTAQTTEEKPATITQFPKINHSAYPSSSGIQQIVAPKVTIVRPNVHVCAPPTENNSVIRKLPETSSYFRTEFPSVSNIGNVGNNQNIVQKTYEESSDEEMVTENDYDGGDTPFWDEANRLATIQTVPLQLAKNFISLLEGGCTLPFIARYRKTNVYFMMPDKLQELYESYQNISTLKKKVKTVLETLRKSKKLTPAIEKSVLNAHSLSELDLVYAPLKSHSLSLAEKARKLGLEPSAVRALNGSFVDIKQLCTNNEELKSPDKVESHITHIIADIIYKDTRVLQQIRILKEKTKFIIHCSQTKSSMKEKENNGKLDCKSDPDTYKSYFDWKCPTIFIKPHQILAINRGEDEKILSIKVNVPDWFYNNLEKFCLSQWESSVWVKKGLTDAYNRLIKPWLSRQVRSELTAQAHKEGITIFTTNLEKYLLTEPIKNRTIAGLDPGFKAGCKVGIINPNGDKLHACTIYPNLRHTIPGDKAAATLKSLFRQFRVDLIGLGNGTACRETESWLKSNNISNENIPIVIVPEQGASIYSISKEAQKEHPDMDPNLISALSIARRVLDPLGELIKVDPKNLGIGLYQHDIPTKLLDSALDCVVEKVVSLVGVDINTASQAMLRRISGLNESRAKKILAYRQENDGFASREEIMKVSGIGKVTFQQCAGFLKVLGGTEPLDATIIHPECYNIARKFANKIAVNINNLTQPTFPDLVERRTASFNLEAVSRELGTDVATLELIISAFKQKSYEENVITFCRPVYSLAAKAIDDLQEGMTLTGVVRNVVPFGCFVDCGVGDNGLIHRKHLGKNRTPILGERVLVTVISSFKANKIQLKLEKILD